MKISEVIKILQKNMDEYGDLQCISDCEGGIYIIQNARVSYSASSEMTYMDGANIFDEKDMEIIGDAAFFLEI